MGGYLAYTKYKDSEAVWLGQIPEHWSTVRLRFLLSESFTNGLFKRRDDWGSGVPIVNVFDIYTEDGIVQPSSLDKVRCSAQETAQYSARHGDFFFVRSSLKLEGIGKSATLLNPTEHVVFECHLVRGRPNLEIVDPKFLNYFLGSQSARQVLIAKANQVTMTTIDQSKFKDISISLPSLPEQQQIAAFLDYKTAQIDALIAKKEALLEKLAEKRTALISQAVTKGLDASVDMKDSGVEWLGEIPANWIAIRLKHVTNLIIDGAHFTPTYVDEGIPFLRVTDVVQASGSDIDLDRIKFIPKEEHQSLSIRCKPEKDDLLYSKNGTIGVPRVIDWSFEFSIFVSLCLIKVIPQKLEVNFLAYSLLGKLTETQITTGAKSNTVTNLHLDKIKEFWVCLPSIEVQQEIVSWLNMATKELDTSIQTVEKAINRLKEYRTALITNAVTGKIDIRDIKLPQPIPSEAS